LSNREKALQRRYATIAALTQAFPACFNLKRPRPLKLRIVVALPAVDPRDLDQALGFWTGRLPYLKACTEGATRVDVTGEPAGVVTAAEAAHAALRLEQQIARKAAAKAAATKGKAAKPAKPPTPKPPPSSPARFSLADLKAAAASRKAGASS
jgi:sRNA-binding protein